MMRCGIDPGIGGGIAFMQNGAFFAGFRMPKAGKEVDAHEVARLLRMYNPEEVVIEQVGPMPHDRPQSAFRFGQNAGVVVGVVVALGHPLVRITPQKWKQLMGLTGKPKEASDLLAKNLWPDHAELFSVKANNGIAEAALIARAQSALIVQEANR